MSEDVSPPNWTPDSHEWKQEAGDLRLRLELHIWQLGRIEDWQLPRNRLWSVGSKCDFMVSDILTLPWDQRSNGFWGKELRRAWKKAVGNRTLRKGISQVFWIEQVPRIPQETRLRPLYHANCANLVRQQRNISRTSQFEMASNSGWQLAQNGKLRQLLS